MRSVKKETMDELARVVRKYWATGDTDILDAKHRLSSELSEQAFGSDAKWLQFCDILNGAICLNRNVSNDTIYKIFGLLCIEVSAPVETESFQSGCVTSKPQRTERTGGNMNGNQCVICGAPMGEGNQVCKACLACASIPALTGYLRYQALGKTPEELQRLIDYAEDPAPLPMDDEKDYSGLLEE